MSLQASFKRKKLVQEKSGKASDEWVSNSCTEIKK